MIKAFLSHSSRDKEFVRAVATHLGRQFCLIDEQVFDSGVTFKESIEKSLDETSVFVLFASKAALESVWVDFEVNEAAFKALEKTIARSLVFLLDSDIDHKNLPPWLQRAKVVRQNAPRMVAREIRYHIDDLLRTVQHQFFEGRTGDLNQFQNLVTPIDGPPPRIIVVHGLPSIGRRTFLRKAADLTLGFSRVVEVRVAQGDSLSDIAIRIANEVEPYSTKAGFETIARAIQASTREDLVERIGRDLLAAISNRELPVLFDDGGLLTSEGLLTEPVASILAIVEANPVLYLCVVSTRKPQAQLATQRLNPLVQDDIRRLVTRIAATRTPPVSMTPHQVTELAEYINGYPPSAYYAVSLASEYGLGVVLADKNRLVEFRTAALVNYLRKKNLTNIDRGILALLARYSPLPIEALTAALPFPAPQIALELAVLIDHSLVVVGESGLYSIAEPLIDAVNREILDEVDHKALHEAVKALVNDENLYMPRLDLYRILFRSAAMAGLATEKMFHLASDLIRMTERFYHERDYPSAIKYGRLAVAERPDNVFARDYLIRALIQEEEWESAEAQITEFQRIAPVRDVDYLKGFLARKRRNLNGAIRHYLDAIEHGRTGVAIQREIAYCYYLNNDLVSAKKYLTDVGRQDNRIALDLWIQIVTREGDEDAARTALSRLEILELEPFYKHRLSTVEMRFGRLERALNAANEAVAAMGSRRPTFGMLAQLATCQVRIGQLDDAEKTLTRIERLHGNVRIDIRLGLLCRVQIERGHFGKALQVLANVRDQSIPVYKAMRRDAIAGELAASALTDDVRNRYVKELETLNRELQTFDAEAAWLFLGR